MYCRNHPDRDAAAVCQKHAVGFCRVRTQCIIREISRERRKRKTAAKDRTRDRGFNPVRIVLLLLVLIAACGPDEPVYPE